MLNIKLIISVLMIILLLSCSDESELPKEEVKLTPPSLSDKTITEKLKLIRLNRTQIEELAIKNIRAEKSIKYFKLIVPGIVYPAPENYSVLSAPLQGRVSKIYAHEGEMVRKGEPLLELESLEFGTMVADYLQARAEANFQENRRVRIEKLVEKKISSQNDLERANADYQRAIAISKSAYAKLKAVGVSDNQISKWSTEDRIDPHLVLFAPISGAINEHLIELGESVDSYQNLLSVIDVSKVQIKAFISPEDAQFVNAGSEVMISQKFGTDTNIKGKILTINPALEETNKSVVANIIVSTKNKWPKPGDNVRLEIQANSIMPVMSIPSSAVVYIEDIPVIYVRKSDELYEERPIVIFRFTSEEVFVAGGIDDGDEIAVSQIFSLKALSRYEEYAE